MIDRFRWNRGARRLLSVAAIAVPIVLLAGCMTPNLTPTAAFTAGLMTGTVPMVVTFDARASVDADGSIVAYRWTFSDGATATGDQVAHVFETPGQYTVTLTVVDDLGAEHSVAKTVTAIEAPPPSGGGTCG
jgi:PKD repeat protein